MRRKLYLPLVVISLLLSGCSLAPEYSQPKAPVPEQWPQGEAYKNAGSAAGATPAAELKWKDFFTDHNLRQIISMALGNNRDLRLAALNVERARALYGIQRAELIPAVNATGGYAKQRTSADLTEVGKPRTTEKYSVDLGVASWEIDFFGRLRNLADQALQEYMATEQARRSAQIALVSEVARAYLTLGADKESLKLAQSTFESQLDAFKLIKKRYDAGVATELDLRRAEAPVESAKVDIAYYRQAVAKDHNALNLLAGSPVPDKLLPAELDSLSPCKDISAGLSSEVLLRRPDIMAAEHRLKGAYAFIGAARAAFFPRISLTSSIGTASNELSGLFGSSSDTWSFVPRIVMPIFDARTWAALRVSKADQKIILTQYEKTIQAAFRDVADTLAVQGTIDPQVAAQQALVKAFSDAYRLSSERYLKGIDSYLGVLDAQRSLFQAQKGLVTLRLAKLANQVKLYAVLGGGSD
jgi:multidrug efflux system outer membrane protein